MESNVQISLASSHEWFRHLMFLLSVSGVLFAALSISFGFSFVNNKSVNLNWAKSCFVALIVIDLGIFIVATNTGPLLRAQYLWSTLLWFFVHLFLLFAVVSISSKDTEGGV